MSFGGFIRRRRFWHADAKNNNGYIKEHYDVVTRALSDASFAEAKQAEYLQEMLEFMTAHSPFYARYNARGCLATFPVMKKAQLIQHHDEMAVPVEAIPHQQGPLYIQKTSGSTGVPFSMPQNTRKRQRRVAEIKAFSAFCGYDSHEPMAQCRVWTKWQSKTSKQARTENIYPVNVLNVSDDSLAETCELVRQRRIVAIRGYASWFTSLMNYLKRTPEALPKLASLKVCIPHSEALDEKTRAYFNDVVGCAMSECYANEECGIFGQQACGSHTFQLNNTGYVFELLKLDSDEPAAFGELGRIVVTDLHQRAFPVIRYDTGDTGIFSPAAPGSALPQLEKLYGRVLDLVFDSNGVPIHPMSFNRVLKNFDHIQQWQFAQLGQARYELRVVADKGFDSRACYDEVASFLGANAQFAIRCVEHIPTLKSGKHRSVVCEWDKAKH